MYLYIYITSRGARVINILRVYAYLIYIHISLNVHVIYTQYTILKGPTFFFFYYYFILSFILFGLTSSLAAARPIHIFAAISARSPIMYMLYNILDGIYSIAQLVPERCNPLPARPPPTIKTTKSSKAQYFIKYRSL